MVTMVHPPLTVTRRRQLHDQSDALRYLGQGQDVVDDGEAPFRSGVVNNEPAFVQCYIRL